MPSSCVVPNCKSNYYKGYVPVFKFPQDEAQRDVWIKKIPRENLQITRNSVVCIKHFSPQFISKYDSVMCSDGAEFKMPRRRIKLVENAYPSIFENDSPSQPVPKVVKAKRMKSRKRLYPKKVKKKKTECTNQENEIAFEWVPLDPSPTHTSPKKTKNKQNTSVNQVNEIEIEWLPLDPAPGHSSPKATSEQENEIQIDWLKSEEINIIDEIDFNEETDSADEINEPVEMRNVDEINERVEMSNVDEINSIADITANPSKFNWSDFIMKVNDDQIYFLKIDYADVPTLEGTIIIDSNLNVKIFHKGIKLNLNNFESVLGLEAKCNSFTKLDNLLRGLSNYAEDNVLEDKIATIKKLLRECSKASNCKNSAVNFMCEQVDLMFSKQLIYSADYLMLSCSLFYSFRSAYRFLRELDLFVLPHPNRLKIFNLANTMSSSSLSEYLRHTTRHFTPLEKKVCLVLDEVCIKPKTSYTLTLTSSFGVKEATTIRTFVIKSLVSKNKDLVALVPVAKLHSKFLLKTTVRVLNLLTSVGCDVVCIVSDYNAANVELFKQLSGGGKIKSCIRNPVDYNKEIHLLFDAAHVVKNLRNNWMDEKTFIYPSFDNYDNLNVCEFSPITKIHDYQKKFGTKYAPGLTYEVCFPNKLERQNVKLALQVFDEQVIDLIDSCPHFLDGNLSGTSRWLNIIRQWWSIVNRKHPDEPIRSLDHQNINYLTTFCEWLRKWESYTVLKSGKTAGKLSPDTYFALLHTTKTLLKLCNYLLNKLEFPYVTLGVFQTGVLEQRFVNCRRITNCNSYVSVDQILESERKLNIASLMKFKCRGVQGLKITDIIQHIDECDETSGFDIGANVLVNKTEEILNDCCGNEIESDVLEAVIFISSCVGLRAAEKLTCIFCKEKLIQYKDLSFENSAGLSYVEQLNKGGLKYPTIFAVQVAVSIYQIFHVLISKKYEKDKVTKEALKSLLFERIEIEDLDPCSGCGKLIIQITNYFINVWINIFFDNYSKNTH